MIRRAAILLALALVSAAQGDGRSQEAFRFTMRDVVVDTGDRELGAYQIEVVGNASRSHVIGVEGGDPRAFRKAPYHDPAALQGGRIILAALSTDEDLPKGRFRVARIHLTEEPGAEIEYRSRLMAAATKEGSRIEVKVELEIPRVKK